MKNLQGQVTSESKAIRRAAATYTLGFVLSAVLTLAAYYSVVNGLLSGGSLTLAVVGLAVTQLLVQLLFFLHVGNEKKPRWNLMALGFMLIVVGIVVIGTLWIMKNLDTHMMPKDMEQYMRMHEGI